MIPRACSSPAPWYRRGDEEVGDRQFIVTDPDGYVLRFFEDLGARPKETA